MPRRPPRSTRSDQLFPYTARFRSPERQRRPGAPPEGLDRVGALGVAREVLAVVSEQHHRVGARRLGEGQRRVERRVEVAVAHGLADAEAVVGAEEAGALVDQADARGRRSYRRLAVDGDRLQGLVDGHRVGEELGEAGQLRGAHRGLIGRSEEHTSELQSLMRISYAVFCLNNKSTSGTRVALRAIYPTY